LNQDNLIAVQLGLTDDIDMMAQDFFPSTDPDAQLRCQWANIGLDLAVQVVMFGVTMGMVSNS